MDARSRDFVGYGSTPPDPKWPKQARIALNFVINYEEGAEANILDKDPAPETYLAEISGMTATPGTRNYFSESVFEYGSRAGFWRLLNIFNEFKVPVTIFATGLALERNPEVAKALELSSHDIVGHGYRWINYRQVSKEEERKDISRTLEIIESCTGKRPTGWYTGRHSEHTRELVVEAGLSYDSDNYSDDLPFWTTVNNKPHLIVPYSFDNNDAKYSMSPGWMSGDDFYNYLRAAFDCLYREGEHAPKMMTVALHGRLSGRPGRSEVVRKFLEYALQHEHVWICNRSDIAKHWLQYHPYKSEKLTQQEEQQMLLFQEAQHTVLFSNKENVPINLSGPVSTIASPNFERK